MKAPFFHVVVKRFVRIEFYRHMQTLLITLLFFLVSGCGDDVDEPLSPATGHGAVLASPGGNSDTEASGTGFWRYGMSMDEVRGLFMPGGGAIGIIEVLPPEKGAHIYQPVVGKEAEELRLSIDSVKDRYYVKDGIVYDSTLNKGMLMTMLGVEKVRGSDFVENVLIPAHVFETPPEAEELLFARLEDGKHRIVLESDIFYNHATTFSCVDGKVKPLILLRRGLMNAPEGHPVYQDGLTDLDTDILDTFALIGRNTIYSEALPIGIDLNLEAIAWANRLESFNVDIKFKADLNRGEVSEDLRRQFEAHGIRLSDSVFVSRPPKLPIWWIRDNGPNWYYTVTERENQLVISEDGTKKYNTYMNDIRYVLEDQINRKIGFPVYEIGEGANNITHIVYAGNGGNEVLLFAHGTPDPLARRGARFSYKEIEVRLSFFKAENGIIYGAGAGTILHEFAAHGVGQPHHVLYSGFLITELPDEKIRYLTTHPRSKYEVITLSYPEAFLIRLALCLESGIILSADVFGDPAEIAYYH